MWLTTQERLVLTGLGALALAAVAVLGWQQRRSPLHAVAGPVPTAQWAAQLAAARRIDLNRASAAELERLPEIGPSLAQRIVEYRQAHGPFRQPEDLRAVPGIGPKTSALVQPYLTVGDAWNEGSP